MVLFRHKTKQPLGRFNSRRSGARVYAKLFTFIRHILRDIYLFLMRCLTSLSVTADATAADTSQLKGGSACAIGRGHSI